MKKQENYGSDLFFWAAIGLFVIAMLVGIMTGGCYSINGFGKDLSAWSSPFVENADGQ